MKLVRDFSGPVIAFLPCRKGSERVPRKNIRPFGDFQYGLVEIKLAQLLACPVVDRVIISTNDEEIIDFASGLSAGAKLIVHHRDDALSSSNTSTDELVGHAHDLCSMVANDGHILWTHVTSPFVTSERYSEIVASYKEALVSGYDSLMSTTMLHTFLWNESGPTNYDRITEKWPRTQTLKPVHEINSAAFLAPTAIYSEFNDRIGANPRLHPLNKLVALDIDWEEDFVIAEQLFLRGLVSI